MKSSTRLVLSTSVIAGLGILTIPNLTYATSVGGNAEVNVQVLPAIAMTIESTSDGDEGCGVANRYSDAEGNTSGKIGDFDGTEGGANEVNDNTSCAKTSMTQNAFDESMSSTITVYTNSTQGYKLSVKSDEPDLKSGTNSIEAGILSGKQGGQGTWSYKTDGILATDWTAMTNGEQEINRTNSYQSEPQITNITYGVSTAPAQPTGFYTTTVNYTATAFDSGEIPDPDEPGGDIVEPEGFDNCGDSCEVEGVTYNRLADNKLWAETSSGKISSPTPASEVCPAGAHLPTAEEYYNLILAYGGQPDSANASPYGASITGAGAQALRAATGWTGDLYASSTPGSDSGEYWALASLGNGNYIGLDTIFTGIAINAMCVAE